jgi:ribonuclease D
MLQLRYEEIACALAKYFAVQIVFLFVWSTNRIQGSLECLFLYLIFHHARADLAVFDEVFLMTKV